MARPEKTAVVEEIRSKLSAAAAAVLTEYRGLSVSELAQLRGALRPAGTEYKVFKNTLARRAVEEAGIPDLVPMLLGPTAIAFVNGDAALAAKALRDFGRQYPALVLKGALLGARVLTVREVEALADVEPRDVLLARIAGGLQAPLTKTAGLLQAFTRNLAYGVKAYLDQRIATGEMPPPAGSEAPAEPATDAVAPAEAAGSEVPTAEAAPETGATDPDEGSVEPEQSDQ